MRVRIYVCMYVYVCITNKTKIEIWHNNWILIFFFVCFFVSKFKPYFVCRCECQSLQILLIWFVDIYMSSCVFWTILTLWICFVFVFFSHIEFFLKTFFSINILELLVCFKRRNALEGSSMHNMEITKKWNGINSYTTKMDEFCGISEIFA